MVRNNKWSTTSISLNARLPSFSATGSSSEQNFKRQRSSKTLIIEELKRLSQENQNSTFGKLINEFRNIQSCLNFFVDEAT